MTNFVISLIRTYVPVGVGAAIAWLAARGLNLDPSVAVGATAALTGVLTAGYYTLVRILEAKFPWLGVLIGHPAKPSYTKR